MQEFNHTIASAVSISVVADNIVCVADAAENLPFSVITSILDIINQAADALARMNGTVSQPCCLPAVGAPSRGEPPA